MTGALGRDEEDVHVLGRQDLAEMDIEAVGEKQGLALGKVGLDVAFVHGGLHFVRQQDHDQVGLGRGFGSGNRGKAMLFGQFVVGAAGALAHHYLDAGIAQVLGVGVALAAVADDGHGLVFEATEVRILIVINFHLIFLWVLTVKKGFLPARAGRNSVCVFRACPRKGGGVNRFFWSGAWPLHLCGPLP